MGRLVKLPLLDGQERLRVRRPDVIRAWPDEPIVLVLLQAVRGPSGDAADGEDWGIQIDRNAERVIRRRRVEVDVGIQLLLAGDDLLDALRHLEPARVAGPFAEVLR